MNNNYHYYQSTLNAIENALFFAEKTGEKEIVATLQEIAKNLHIHQANALIESAKQN